MSRSLIKEKEERELRRLHAHLLNTAKKSEAKAIALSKKDAHNILSLIGTILIQKPIVVDEYLTPNDAAEIAGVSRPIIIDMLKSGSLIGHKVGKHWRVKKESLVSYINSRDMAFKSADFLDEAGFGLD